MNRHLSRIGGVAAIVLALTQAASAHPGYFHVSGFAGGVAHPYTGIDHILAMIAVGLLAAQLGGRALWLLPLTFVSLMVGGGMLNLAGVPVPLVEHGIVASVLILGLLIAAAWKLPLAIPVGLVGLFAVFHGFAHVAEMNAGAAPAGYALGFILATASLHAIGVALGLAAARFTSAKVVRVGGGAIAICGLLLAAGVING